MKTVTAEQMRELDKRTMEEFGVPGDVLMERAGQGVADAIRRHSELAGFPMPLVHLIAGRGNNGGDAYVAARTLKSMGLEVDVWVACAADELQGDALKHFSLMKSEGVRWEELDTRDAWEKALAHPIPSEVIVDGVLGTGTHGPARGPAAGAIEYIKSRSDTALIVSIDIPSGLDADTGEPLGDTVSADLTVTIGLPKHGMLEPKALEYVGSLDVVDIGIPAEAVEETPGHESRELIHPIDLRGILPRRARHAHKGSFGRVLLIGGAPGYAGAIAMSAQAAVRSGAGLVTAIVPAGIVPIVASASLETMVVGEEENRHGSLSANMVKHWLSRHDEFDAILIGPGMTRSSDTLTIVREYLRQSQTPIVLDADALAVLENQPDWLAKAEGPVVVTPHPGELALLFVQDVNQVQDNRLGMAIAAAKYTGATIALKGAGTVVASPDRMAGVNLTGNPGMATGGSGDVLSGLIAGLLAQGLAPHDATQLGVYLHGRAGDILALRKSQATLIPTDLIQELAYAFRDVALR